MKIHKIKPALDRRSEAIVSYYQHVPAIIDRVCGREPSRQSLHKYLNFGFPVRRGGPRVAMPHFRELNEVKTTIQAMERWAKLVRSLR